VVLRLRFGVESVVLEFELWVLVLLSLGSGLGFDLSVRELDLALDLKNPILLSWSRYLWDLVVVPFSAVFGVLDVWFGLVWFGFGLGGI
jgi:hypothetical protein